MSMHYLRKNTRTLRICASLMGLTLLSQAGFPTIAYALTSGPAQPEFSSFEPVVTSNMVQEFTGDFMYNLPVLQIPGPNGAGYALSLSYHGGASPEEEASWVGYGWTLNPGAINRQMRGFPDDWNGVGVTVDHKSPWSHTVSVTGQADIELLSNSLNLGGNATMRYNNYTGYGYTAGIGVTAGGVLSLGYSVTDGDGSFSLSVNPAKIHSAFRSKDRLEQEKTKNEAKTEEPALETTPTATETKNVEKTKFHAKPFKLDIWDMANAYGMKALQGSSYPLNAIPMTGQAWTISAGGMPTASPLQMGVNVLVAGKYAVQKPDEKSTPDVNGFMYSDAVVSDADAMDYHVENLSSYEKRDKFLSVPLHDADMYCMTGEAISGSARLYQRSIIPFRPTKAESHTDLFRTGGEFEAGQDLGVGAQVQFGKQTMDVGGWNGQAPSMPADEPYFFRMSNDPGGWLMYYGTEDPQNASVGYDSYSDYLPGNADDGMRGRSSYVGFNTKQQRIAEVGGVRYQAYEKADLTKLMGPELSPVMDPAIAFDPADLPNDQIAEMSVVNGQGQRYTYGLPVYSRNEINKSYSIDQDELVITDHALATTGDDPLANEDPISFISGQVAIEPYASAYLLTSITDADYIDLHHDGVSLDDLGGFTAFRYTQSYGTENKNSSTPWFRWRMPYNGFMYEQNMVSECHDDRVSFSSGEKEIYYLHTIETKSHVALFVLSEDNTRLDARSAQLNASSHANGFEPAEQFQQNYLQRIELYSREELRAHPLDARPIKTVHFDYNYEAWPNVHNNGVMIGDAGPGKLTLKRVWFEHNGVVPAKIAPYQFEYEYPSTSYPIAGLTSPYASAQQNPEYTSILANDPWGCYRSDGDSRAYAMEPWLDQTRYSNSPPFDPAAWQLKKIILPSGGEIHVQYEPDDYLFVQDQRAHAMVRLEEVGLGYAIIDLSDLGIPTNDPNDPDLLRLRDLIHSIYVQDKKKMYFKYLYSLTSATTPNQYNGSKDAEYIDGYVSVSNVDLQTSPSRLRVEFASTGDHILPHQVCQDLFNASKRGRSTDGSCYTTVTTVNGHKSMDWNEDPLLEFSEHANDDVDNDGDALDAIVNAVGFLTSILPGSDECAVMDETRSYLRLPIPRRKYGGGLRVKRLLMYDHQATSAGYPAVFGQEYRYEKIDDYDMVVSSGVATNEPTSIREENILIRQLDAFRLDDLTRIISGRDKENSEGPLGYSIYPAPSVGYSQVIVSNIGEAAMGTNCAPNRDGFSVKEFHTAKEFPIDFAMTTIDKVSVNPPPVITPYAVVVFDQNYLSQGFTLKFNNMHGQIHRETTHAGTVELFLDDEAPPQPISTRTEYEYYAPGERVPIMEDRYGTIGEAPLGLEQDLTKEHRSAVEELTDGSIEGDVSVSIPLPPPPIPQVGIGATGTYSTAAIKTHTITKVINYPAILKRTRTYQDGIQHISEPIAFDPRTGEPCMVRTHDGFLPSLNESTELASAANGIYTKQTIPAHEVYPALGQKAKGERKWIGAPGSGVQVEVQNPSGTTAELILSATSAGPGVCDALNAMCVGDLFAIDDPGSSDVCLYHMVSIEGSKVNIVQASYSGSFQGTGPATAGLSIVRSGCSNQVTLPTGDFTVYDDGALVNNTDWNLRQLFVGNLNAALTTLNTTPCGGPQTIPITVPTGLLFANGSNCIESVSMDMDVFTGCQTIVLNGTFVGLEGCPDGGFEFDASTYGADWGQFSLDPINGELLYGSTENLCFPVRLDCPQFCPSFPLYAVDKVVNCSATEFSDVWSIDPVEVGLDPLHLLNVFETGERGKWRPFRSYSYRTPTEQGGKNRNTGWYDLEFFNYDTPAENDETLWILNNEVIAYSPDGNAIEEENALGIRSCSKYGYDRQIPYLVAQNCVRELAHFESFERKYVDGSDVFGEDLLPITPWGLAANIDPSVAHTGKHSFKMEEDEGYLFRSKPITSTYNNIHDKQLSVKAWIRCREWGTTFTDPTALSVTVNALPFVDMHRVARSGEWSLYEAVVDWPTGASTATIDISCINPLETVTWIDDVRIQPVDAQMTTYVYDPNSLRLVASMDDQHFALFYQYNDEGKLVRKLIETERGIRSVQETQYHTPLIEDQTWP